MRQVTASIAALHAVADTQAALAEKADDRAIAEILGGIARSHRMRAAEMQAELAALRADYSAGAATRMSSHAGETSP
nr:hypothetical protein NG677_24000 [Methylobacterium sp.]